MKYLRVFFIVAALAGIAATAWAQPPVPFYATNVTNVDKLSAGTVVIETKDALDVVCAWYRKNLAEATGENKTKEGFVIFYTKSGATVAVKAGDQFDPGTRISLVWNATKFGPYTGK